MQSPLEDGSTPSPMTCFQRGASTSYLLIDSEASTHSYLLNPSVTPVQAVIPINKDDRYAKADYWQGEDFIG